MIEICRWNELFENNRSREIRNPAYCLLPNRHDGESYGRLMLREDAAEIFTAWVLMVQVASRSQVRGTLLRDDRTPHDAESLAIKTRAKKEWFEKAFPILVELRWIVIKSGIPQEGAARVRQGCGTGATEQNRTEQNRTEENTWSSESREIKHLWEAFDNIWLEYPKRVGKKQAVRHFRASVQTDADLIALRQALSNYKASERVRKGYVQNASTWFNNWRDWVEYKEDGKGQAIDVVAEAERIKREDNPIIED